MALPFYHFFRQPREMPLRQADLPPPGTVVSMPLKIGFDHYIEQSPNVEAVKKVHRDLRDLWQRCHRDILADHVTPDIAMRMYNHICKYGITPAKKPNAPAQAWRHHQTLMDVIRHMGLFQMATPYTYLALKLIKKPREAGRRVKKPRAPVTNEELERVLAAERTESARDLWRLMDLIGARPGELASMHWSEIDRSGDVWIYSPPFHKNSWREKDREIVLGPKAQAIVRRHGSKVRGEKGPLFRTLEGRKWVVQQLSWKLNEACDRAHVARFTHTDLRRRHANRVCVEFGPNYEAAVLGHSPEVAVRHYLQVQREMRREAALKLS